MTTSQQSLEHDRADRVRRLGQMQALHHEACPVCGDTGKYGLMTSFDVSVDGIAEMSVVFRKEQEGYEGHVHGGFIATALDGAMTNCLFSHGIAAVTGEITVRIVRPVPSRQKLLVRSRIKGHVGQLYMMSAELLDDNQTVAKARGKFVNVKRKRRGTGNEES